MPRAALPRSVAVLGFVLGWSLACGGGVSVDPETQMEPICSQVGRYDIRGELVQLDLPVVEPRDGIPVRIDTAETTVDLVPVASAGELEARLGEKAEEYRTLRMIRGMDGTPPPVMVMIAPDVPAERVAEVLVAAHAAGMDAVDLVVWSQDPVELPPYPDPAYAASLKAKLDGISPDMRQTQAAQEIMSLISLCPGMQRAFEAVAYVSPDMKCELITAGMAEALPYCPLTDGDKVVTAIQVISEPPGDFAPTVVKVDLDPEGTPIDATGTWADLAPRVAALQGPLRVP